MLPLPVLCLRIGVAALWAGTVCACSAYTPPPVLAPAARAERIVGTVYLVGDAGVPDSADPVLAALRAGVVQAPARTTVAFLGDNIYPAGLPAADAPDRDAAEARLRAQLEAARGAARVVFIPGNHDWARHREDGWEAVLRQATFIAESGVPNAQLLPDGGCPGPVEVAGGPLRMAVLDTHWWLHDGPKPIDPSSSCAADAPGEVTAQLRGWLAADSATPAIVLGHHPLLTGGVHGGQFGWREHVFPLTAWKPWFWLPLPVIGSAYPLARGMGISNQDLSSGRYETLRDSLAAAFRARPPLLYAAGHEHNLQVLDGAALGVHTLVVSGAGSFAHTGRTVRLPQTRFAREASGFVRLDVLDDGSVRLAVIVVRRDRSAREAYSEWLGGQALDTSRTRSVRAGAHYAAGGLHRLLFGTDYRALWTAELGVPLLDLTTFAGGLTPTTAGGGLQTKSLRFRGADGYPYGFRSVDKDPAVLPPEYAGTFIEDLFKDQTSSQHPAAPAVVSALAGAAGVLHTEPRLVVLPDDPRLGPHRERFAGTLGFIERRATIEPDRPAFAGALEIIETDELYARTQQGPSDAVEVDALLAARLFDLFIGDWDRHRGQFTWARRGDAVPRVWVPIPEDRDQAFARFDGLMLGIARLQAPFLLNFGDEYAGIFGATWNGRDLDRRFLTVVDSVTWDSVATAIVGRLTDTVIDEAVRHLPPEMYALDGRRLAQALKRRRDALRAYAARYRRHLVKYADVHGTDAAEQVTIERGPNGVVAIELATSGNVAHVRAAFFPHETEEIRLYLHAGEDRVVVRGGGSPIRLRIVGGGQAHVVDSTGAGRIRLYATGDDRAVGDVDVDRRASVAPPPRRPYEYARDRGSRALPVVWLAYGPDLGLTLGGGVARTTYGFRKFPFASQVHFRSGFAFDAARPRAELDVRWNQENSRRHTTLFARASGIEVVRFHGLGNETALTESDEYYRVRQEQYRLAPALHFPVGASADLFVGAVGERIRTRTDSGRIIAATAPAGSGVHTQAGIRTGIELDTRDLEAYPTRGFTFRLEGRLYPPLADVDSLYGALEGAATTYLTAALPLRPTLALRAGGKGVFGPYPFFEAAFIGDARTARLGHQNRFAGDAAVYGNAELRLRLTRFFVILPGELGVFGLADAGRVFLEGESSRTWHAAFGGGLWVSVLGPGNVLSAAIAASDERTALYLGLGATF